MADFRLSIEKILKAEGGYVNDPDDTGGETYKGVSRNNWPHWAGWLVIDAAKKQPNFPRSLYSKQALTESVIAFYKQNFWDRVGGDYIASQDIANMLVDSAVNEGIAPAIRRAQKIVGIEETGKIDLLLISKLNSL